jgi:hypothetical protein
MITNKKLLFVLLANIFITIPIFAGSVNNNTHSSSNYDIAYPSDWKSDTSKTMGTDLILFSSLTDSNDTFRENVNVLVQDLSAYDLTLDQYVQISEKQVKTMITDGKIILNERKAGPRGEFHKMIYTGKQGVFNLKYEQHFWLVNKKAYVLSFTCEESQYVKYQQIREQIMNSFKLK